MTNFLSLIKVQLLSLVSSNKLQSKNKKAKAGMGGIVLVLLILGASLIAIGFLYANIFSMSLEITGEIDKLIPLMLALGSLICFLFSFYVVGSALFGFKDYDLLMSMPIKSSEIVLSKFCVLYISELFFSALITIPSIFVYAQIATIDFNKIVSSIALVLFSPLLPLAISTLIGVVVYYISSRFRRKNIIQTIMLVLIMLGVFFFSFMSGFNSEDPEQMANTFGVIGKIYFIFPFAVKAFTEPLWILIFVLVNLIPAIIVIAFISYFYKKLNTIFTAKRTLRNFKLGEYQTNSVNKTLFNKEVKRLFSSPIYVMNCLIGVILSLIVSIGYSILVLVYNVNLDPEADIVFWVINRLMPGIFGFMFLLAPTTCCAISMEGKAFWIIKTAPVSHIQVLNSKLYVHAVCTTVPAVISALFVGLCTGFGWLASLLFVVFAVALSSFGGVFGLLMNLRFPKLNWTNENVPVKQGLSVFLTMLVSFVCTGAMIAISIIFMADISFELLLAIYAGFFMALTFSLYIVLYKRGGKIFDKLN